MSDENLDTEVFETPAPVVHLTDEEKENFFKSFLSDTPYHGTENLFDGKFIVEFKALTVKESDDVFVQLKKDQLSNYITNDASYALAMTNYRLALSISKINDEEFQPEIKAGTYKPKDQDDSYVKARAEKLRSWSVFKLSALAEAFKTFEDKIIALTRAIEDPGFWRAAE